MSKLCPLFSGSTGNSTYLGTQNGGILVDAGASFKGIFEALKKVGASVEDIIAVAVTHEHFDHIKGLKTFLNKTNAKLVASEATLNALQKGEYVPAKTEVIVIENNTVEINGIELNRFPTMHDCEGSSGYSFSLPDGKKASICTDLGVVTDTVRNALKNSDVLLFESNHDVEMLKKGPYPPLLKVRIMSEKGHISNIACAAELGEFLKSGTTRFVLGHLSQKNNTPELAFSAAKAALIDIGAQYGVDYTLSVASVCDNGVVIF